MKIHQQKAKLLLLGVFLVASELVRAQSKPVATVEKPRKSELILASYSNYFILAEVVNGSMGLEWIVKKEKRNYMFAAGLSYGWGLWNKGELNTAHAESPYFVYGIQWSKKRIQPEFNVGLIWPRDPGLGFFVYPIITGGARYYVAKSPLMLRAGIGTGGLLLGVGCRIYQQP
jgi:hypothetical protein